MTPSPPAAISPPLVLATDGSPSAQMAQLLVQAIAALFIPEPPNAEHSPVLTVITVQPRLPKRAKRSLKKDDKGILEAIAQEAPTDTGNAGEPNGIVAHTAIARSDGLSLEQLTALIYRDFPPDFPLSLQVRQGRPVIEILNCARTLQAGLIAVGHRGGGGVRELLLGSVSTAIARYAPCSVLVARTQPDRMREPSLRHALLVVDSSLASPQAVATVRALVPAGIQMVTLLHVQAPLNAGYMVTPFVSRTSSRQLDQSLQDAQREQGERILQQAVSALEDAHLNVQTRLHTGDIGSSVCQIAQEIEANLIVLGSDATRRSLLSPLQAVRLPRRQPAANESRSVLRNTRLSVTDDYVIHYAPCPVLLCRATATAP